MPSMAASHGGVLYYVVKVPKDEVIITCTDSGWDNPFRPDGDLSKEADHIVELIKEGKPITPTPGNGTAKLPSGDEADSAVTSTQVTTSNQAPGASPQKGSNGAANCSEKAASPGALDVQRKVVTSSNAVEAEHVVLKKKPKCKCCVIQ